MNKCLIVSSSLLLLLCLPLSAQVLNVTLSQVHEFRELEVDTRIKAISKDSCGLLWIGADSGLYRFDGTNVSHVDIPFVKAIFKTRAEQLLVVADGGLFELQTEQHSWKLHPLLSATTAPTDTTLFYPKLVYEAEDGVLWIGEDESVVRLAGGQMQRFHFPDTEFGVYLFRSFSFAEDGFGRLWLGTFDGQMYYFNPNLNQFIKVNTPVSFADLSTISAANSDLLWLGTRQGMYKLKVDQDGNIIKVELANDLSKISRIEQLDEGLLVATRTTGLHQLDLAGNSEKIPAIKYAEIQDFHSDGQDFYIATPEIVLSISRSIFEIVPPTNGVYIPTINQTPDHRVIVNEGERLLEIRQTFDGITSKVLFDSEDVFFINDALLTPDKLWLATSTGIYNFDLERQTLKCLLPSDKQDWYQGLVLDQEGTLWVSNRAGGPAVSISPNKQLTTWPDLSFSLVIRGDAKGNLYFGGTDGQLFRKAPGQAPVSLAINFPSNLQPTIKDIDCQSDSLLIATSIGLFSMAKEGLREQAPLRQLISGDVGAVLLDQQKNIWFSDATGLHLWTPTQTYTYTQMHGIPSRYISEQGMITGKYNSIFACTSRGLSLLTSPFMLDHKSAPPSIATLLVRDKPVAVRRLNLGAFQSNSPLEFNFTTLMASKASISYRMRLFLGKELVQTRVSQGKTLLFNLKPGSYRLSLQSREEGLQWSDPLAYDFTIWHPWYKTGLARFGILLFIILGIGLGVRIYNRRLRQSNERLEELIQERTRLVNEQKKRVDRAAEGNDCTTKRNDSTK